ncbi:MAG: MBL fold metallo-hydrolase [Dehalococcoidia bacterium]|jgi:glyoxylase-like metal-dependent hydrolase (beta-lactamase superfamily II)|nr:MBL fold metallo-hydrolase [Dehalococcoidia bacterium]MDW8007941.1 MBL fold metallo-hydrolase [Chloroflexota bacterium]
MSARLRLGQLELLVVSDGPIRFDAGATFGVTPRVLWEPLVGPLDEQHRLPLGLNCLVVRSGGRTVLIETGVGSKRGSRSPAGAGLEETGQLLEALAREGIGPRDVDAVINTHLHFDHAGGNTRLEDGRPVPTFPRARYFVPKGEWEEAQRPNERTRATYLPENFEPLDDAGQVELVEGTAEVLPGVRMVPAPGHTAHHYLVELESGGELAIYLGEVAQHPLMLERVAWLSAFDVLPLVNLETKKKVIEKALERRALLIAVHAPYPGLGRLVLEGDRRRWLPLSSQGHE